MVILKAVDPRKPGSIEVLALKEFILESYLTRGIGGSPGFRNLGRFPRLLREHGRASHTAPPQPFGPLGGSKGPHPHTHSRLGPVN